MSRWKRLALDTAAAAHYGRDNHTPAMADKEILRRLVAVNLSRASRETSPYSK
jgi:hypothetical protein